MSRAKVHLPFRKRAVREAGDLPGVPGQLDGYPVADPDEQWELVPAVSPVRRQTERRHAASADEDQRPHEQIAGIAEAAGKACLRSRRTILDHATRTLSRRGTGRCRRRHRRGGLLGKASRLGPTRRSQDDRASRCHRGDRERRAASSGHRSTLHRRLCCGSARRRMVACRPAPPAGVRSNFGPVSPPPAADIAGWNRVKLRATGGRNARNAVRQSAINASMRVAVALLTSLVLAATAGAEVRAGRFSDGRHREVAFMLWTTPSIGATHLNLPHRPRALPAARQVRGRPGCARPRHRHGQLREPRPQPARRTGGRLPLRRRALPPSEQTISPTRADLRRACHRKLFPDLTAKGRLRPWTPRLQPSSRVSAAIGAETT